MDPLINICASLRRGHPSDGMDMSQVLGTSAYIPRLHLVLVTSPTDTRISLYPLIVRYGCGATRVSFQRYQHSSPTEAPSLG